MPRPKAWCIWALSLPEKWASLASVEAVEMQDEKAAHCAAFFVAVVLLAAIKKTSEFVPAKAARFKIAKSGSADNCERCDPIRRKALRQSGHGRSRLPQVAGSRASMCRGCAD